MVQPICMPFMECNQLIPGTQLWFMLCQINYTSKVSDTSKGDALRSCIMQKFLFFNLLFVDDRGYDAGVCDLRELKNQKNTTTLTLQIIKSLNEFKHQ